jgi:ELWxxDGT repeat protein
MPKCMLPLVCALAIAVLTRAQEPFRFMDINQQASPSQGPSAWLGAPRWVDVDYHSGPTQALGRLPKVLGWHYFVVNYGELGAELWRTLGTSASTELVIDLREGGQGSLPREKARKSIDGVPRIWGAMV